MDIGLPGMSGIEGVAMITSVAPATEILMVTVYEDKENIFQAIRIHKEGIMKRSLPVAAAMAVLLFACACSASHARDEHKGKKMQFLIEMKHTPAATILALLRSTSSPSSKSGPFTGRSDLRPSAETFGRNLIYRVPPLPQVAVCQEPARGGFVCNLSTLDR
jgi:DNA-binding NarL/FixJ family response regulator